ncbi:MAG: alpha/beta hydrolase [Thiolinea sp.]
MKASHYSTVTHGSSIPVLLLYGDNDELVPEKPVNQLWERLPKQGNSRQIRYKNGWHMLMRDLQGKKVIADIAGWMPRLR